MAQQQNLKNHVRLDPMFHGFLFIGALILLGASTYALIRQPDWMGAVRLFGVLWLIILMFKVRLYALKVQDRVIRLEERLRLMQLMPAASHAGILELTESQLVALRFASDAEAPALAAKALEGKWEPKRIKEAIQVWRPDFFRV